MDASIHLVVCLVGIYIGVAMYIIYALGQVHSTCIHKGTCALQTSIKYLRTYVIVNLLMNRIIQVRSEMGINIEISIVHLNRTQCSNNDSV